MIAMQCPHCDAKIVTVTGGARQACPCPDCGRLVQLTNISSTLRPISEQADTLEALPRLHEQGQGPLAWPVVPGFEILGELGRGGMGVVYKARHEKLQRLVALKMMLSVGQGGPERLARFRTEAEAVARLQHSNVVQIYEIGEHHGLPFLSLEYCAGGSLADQLDGTPLAARTAASVVEAVALAVQAAHEAGIVHRDLKPANILLAGGTALSAAVQSGKGSVVPSLSDASLKLTDFGLAKKMEEPGHTASGAVLGTPSYLAPEQGLGQSQAIGPAVDIYALGAILYELLIGRPPFKGESTLDTIMQAVSQEPVPPSRLNSKVPVDLETICLKCLEKAPSQRYPSAAALADDLRRFQAGEPISARPLSMLGRSLKWGRRRPAVAGLLASLAATFALGFSLVTILYFSANQAAARAQANFETAEQLRHQADESAREHARLRVLADASAKEHERLRNKAEADAKEHERLRKQAEADAREHARLREEADNAAKRHATLRSQAENELAEQRLLTREALELLGDSGKSKAVLEKSPAAFYLPFRLACSYARSAAGIRKDDQRPEAERVKLAEQHEARAVQLLGKAYGPGVRPEERELLLTEPDLVAMRDREDFKRLVAEQKPK